MVSVRKLVGDERKYCTHCDDRALYVLYYCNPKIVQQSSCGALCPRCMALLKSAVVKATAPNSARKEILLCAARFRCIAQKDIACTCSHSCEHQRKTSSIA